MITAKQARDFTTTQTMVECYDLLESAIKAAARCGETYAHATISLPYLNDEIAKWACIILVQNGYAVNLFKATDKINVKDYYTFMIRW